MVILQLEEQPPLIQAIFSGEVETVRKFLKSKQHVNYQDFEKRSALHAAAFRGDPAMTKLLIEHGARVNAKDCKWMTPLHRACYSGSEETVTILLNNAADICARDRLWQTPLHIAAASNSLECVSCLLEKIQNPNLTDRAGRTALYHAVLNGHNDIVEMLIAKGCSVNACKKKDRPIHWAAYNGHVETMEILLQHGADINAQDRTLYTPLHVAAASGAISVIDILMENGAQIDAKNAYGNTPLHIACLNGHGNFASELIRYKADREVTNDKGQTPLHLAAASIHGVHCLNILVSHGVDLNKPNHDGRTPLHMTAIHGRFTRSKTLIDKGATVDCLDKNNCSALHIAAQYGHELLSNTLLSHGANPSRKGSEGRTPLHMCCLSGYIECCRIFIKAGVDLNDRDNSGKTSLHCAAYKGAVECVDLLVSSGADFKITDDIGRTALHYAAAQGFFFCVFTLVGIGSPVNQADGEGCTALHLAAAYDMDGRCVNYLLEHKADPKLKDPKGFTPIHYAVAENNVNALKYLLYAVENCNLYGPELPLTTPLHVAAKNGNMEILEKLMPYFPDPNIRDEHGCTPLLLAACHGYANCVQMLLRYGAKVSICDNINRLSPVHHSAKNGHVHCLALLVDNAEDKSIIDLPDGLQRTALMLAISNSYIDCATTLLKSGADPNTVDGDGHSCLFRAVVTGQDNVLQVLLNRSTVVNAKDVHGKTVLHVAAACGRYTSLERILPYMDADIKESPDKNDYTALHWACYSGNAYCVDHFFNEGMFKKLRGNAFSPVHCATSVGSKKCLELLCTQYGSDMVKLKDDKRRGPLHVAALQGHVDCAKFLLEQGADINFQDDDGRTPLISAASNGRVQVMEILINNKADVTLYDKNGNTALHMACLEKHSQAALLLLEYISDADIINMVNNDRKTPLHLSARNGLVDVTRQLILKGSSVTAVDANGLTPALCCAPNPSVAQCLAIILASHSVQASNDKELLVCPDYIRSLAETATSKATSSRKTQTDVTLVKDPDQYDLEQMFEVKFQAGASSSSEELVGNGSAAASRFFIHYKSRDDSEANLTEREPTADLRFDENYSRTAILELHSSQSDTVLAPKPIYSEEDYEKMIKQSNEEKAPNVCVARPSLKTTRRKTKIKDDLRFSSGSRQAKQEHFKSKSAASVLTTFRSDSSSDFVSDSSDVAQNKEPVLGRKSEKLPETLERIYTGAIPKTTRFPKSTNKRLKSQKVAEEDDPKDHSDRCHVCKQFLGSSESDDQNIPLETMQVAIERALAKKGCSSNRCLLAFLDESYELNAKNAHLIYHGMLSPKCEPYIAKHLNLTVTDVEIVESTGEETNYTIRKVKSTGLDALKPKSTRSSHVVKNKDNQQKAAAPRVPQDKPSKLIFNKQNRNGKSDLKTKMLKDDENIAKSVQRRMKDTKRFGSFGQRNFRNLVMKSELDLEVNRKAAEVQKVQSDSHQKVYGSRLKKPKNLSITDVTNQQDGDGNYNKMNACGQKVPVTKQEESKVKDLDGEPFPEYLKPLTNFHLDPLTGGEDCGGRVRCYSTYWCFPELKDNSNNDDSQKNEQENEERPPQAKVESKSDSHFVKKNAQRGDSTSHDSAYTGSIKSEVALKKVAAAVAREPSVEKIPLTFLRTSRSGSNPEKDGMIYFNDKLVEESSCTIRENQEIAGELIDDEEIEELERLRHLDENASRQVSSEVVQDISCNLERRAGVLDIKKNSTENVEDWCEDMQQFFTKSRRNKLAEDAGKPSTRVNVEEWRSLAVKSASKLEGDPANFAKAIDEEFKNENALDDVIKQSTEALSKASPKISDDVEAIPVKMESPSKKGGPSKSNNYSCVLIEDGEVLRSPTTAQVARIDDNIEVHYDNKNSMMKSSEYCGEHEERTSSVTVPSSSKSSASKMTDCDKTLKEDVSMFNDIATVNAEEHLIKNTILNEHSEAFLELVKNRSEKPSNTGAQVPQGFARKRILIRKTDGENEDKFIMKKPAKVAENIGKRRDEKPINWKLYMAHRCLQLSDNMNEQTTQRSWNKKRISQCYLGGSSSTLFKEKKKQSKNSELSSDFRKTRSTEPDEKLKHSYRYSGLKFEEHDESTLKIADLIDREIVEKPKRVNFSERVYVVKDKETIYSLAEDDDEDKPGEEDAKVALDDWQSFIEEGNTKSEEIIETVEAATSSSSNSKTKNTDFVDLPKRSPPKSFLETIDIKDFVGCESDDAKNVVSKGGQEEDEKSDDETHPLKSFKEPSTYMSEFVDIDYELDKLEEELKKDMDTERPAKGTEMYKEPCDGKLQEIDAEFEENILKLEEEKTDEDYSERDEYDLKEMYKFEDSGREHLVHTFEANVEEVEEERFDVSQEDPPGANETVEAAILKEDPHRDLVEEDEEDDSFKASEPGEYNIEAAILRDTTLSFNEIECEPYVEEVQEEMHEEEKNLEITYAANEGCDERAEFHVELLQCVDAACKDFEEDSNLREETLENVDAVKREDVNASEEAAPDVGAAKGVASDHYGVSDLETTEEMAKDKGEIKDVIEDQLTQEPAAPANEEFAVREEEISEEDQPIEKTKSETSPNEEKYLCLDSSSDDTVILKEEHHPRGEKLKDRGSYLKNTPSEVSSTESDEDFDMLDTGFSQVKIDEMMKLKYNSSAGDNSDNPMAMRYVEESSSADSLDDSIEEEEVRREPSKSNPGDGQSEETCTEDVRREEEAENSQSEDRTTSLERSDEYHDANFLEMDDVETLPEDNEDNIYFDTESESSASNTEIVLREGSNSVVVVNEESPPKVEDNVETNEEKLLVQNYIRRHLEKIIAEKCLEPPIHNNKRNSSQKSVHFKFGKEENQTVDVNSNPTKKTNDETSPATAKEENRESLSSLNTIYHVERENLQGAFVESSSDMNCLGQIICEGKAQQALFNKRLNEKISLIEGVAPSEGQVNEKIEDEANVEGSKPAPLVPSGEDTRNIVEERSVTENSSNEAASEEKIEEVKETSSDSIESGSGNKIKEARSEEGNFEESKYVGSNVTVMQLKQNIKFFTEQASDDVSLSTIRNNSSEDESSILRNEDESISSSVFDNISEDAMSSGNSTEENSGGFLPSSMKKIDEQCEEIKVEKGEYEDICNGIKLTQNYVEGKGIVEDGSIREELLMENQTDMSRNTAKMPECTSSDFKKAVKISRNVKVEDTDEYLLLDERRSGEIKKNKKSFPSVSKLGKKAKKDSNCKIS